MPWINGRFYANPTYGRAVERARENGRGASLLDLDTAENEDANGHWVTIGGRHVLIQGGPKEGSNAPKDSRSDLVLIPAGSGKPRANLDMNGFWTISWKLRERNGDILEPLGNKYSGSVVQLTESINGGPFKAAGNQKGGFRDIISPETRTIIQRFAVDGKRIQVVLGRDAMGKLIRTWDVRMSVKYPNVPTYSAAP